MESVKVRSPSKVRIPVPEALVKVIPEDRVKLPATLRLTFAPWVKVPEETAKVPLTSRASTVLILPPETSKFCRVWEAEVRVLEEPFILRVLPDVAV